MNDLTAIILLRMAGGGLIFLAVLHVPIGRRLEWRQQAALLMPVNASIFRVHNFFIIVMLLMIALPCLIEPQIFLIPSRAAAWMSWSFSVFWAIRLYCQWLVYETSLWRGKRLETAIHLWMTLVWLGLGLLFAYCGLRQSGWLK